MSKYFIGKNTLNKLMRILKTDLTNNHNHDNRYYTEDEVNTLLEEKQKEIISLSALEDVDVTWNDTNFPGNYAGIIQKKNNKVVHLHVAKYNEVSHIPVNERVVIGKLNNNRPICDLYVDAKSVNNDASEISSCGNVLIRPDGDIILILEKQCSWLLSIDAVYIVQN